MGGNSGRKLKPAQATARPAKPTKRPAVRKSRPASHHNDYWVQPADGIDLSVALVTEGLAWHYTQYSDDPVLAAAEA